MVGADNRFAFCNVMKLLLLSRKPWQTMSMLLCLCLAMPNAMANSNYSEGLQAYLDGNYELAQAMWLKAAQNNHARSMFNLGLLHQQNKIERAEDEKAEQWFSLAAKNGYVPANYHLAQWLREKGGNAQRIRALEQQSAAAGYPATRARAIAGAPKTSPARNADGTSSTTEPYQRESWIQGLPPTQWTIQMLAFKEKSKVHQFIDEHDLHRRAAYFKEASNDGVLYKLIYGAYGSKEQAELARQNLSGNLKEYGPWLRPVANIQSVIAQQ